MHTDLTLYFIRHGETDWNAQLRYQGQTDIPLNATGRAQSRRNGLSLKAFVNDLTKLDFVSSPLRRTRETIEIIRENLALNPKDYRVDHRLIELSYGIWEGHLLSDLEKIDTYGVEARARDPFYSRPHGGESYADLRIRTLEWLQTVTRDTVVVSHGGVSRCLRGHILQLPEKKITELESPQDKVLVLKKGSISWI
ncbi:MAG: histidine phosphatase family protein [Hyphomicrobium sp.]